MDEQDAADVSTDEPASVPPIDGKPSSDETERDDRPTPMEQDESCDKNNTETAGLSLEMSDDSANGSAENVDDAVISSANNKQQSCNGDTATDASKHSDKEEVSDSVDVEAVDIPVKSSTEQDHASEDEVKMVDEGEVKMVDEGEVKMVDEGGREVADKPTNGIDGAKSFATENAERSEEEDQVMSPPRERPLKVPPSSASPRKTPQRLQKSKSEYRTSLGGSSKHDDSDVDDIDLSKYDVSMEDFEVDGDDEVVSSPVKSSPSKPVKKKKKKKKMRKFTSYGRPVDKRPPSAVVEEQFYEPFKHGWCREVVIRNTYDEVTKSGKLRTRPADVYYFAPTQQKLRSKLEITKFLETTDSPLTVDQFTFLKEPIHKEPFEVVRMAGAHKGRYPPVKSPQKTVQTPSPAPQVRRKVGRPPKARPSTETPVSSSQSPKVTAKTSPATHKTTPNSLRVVPLGRPPGSSSLPVTRPPPSALTPRPTLTRPVARGTTPTSLPSPPALTCRPTARPSLSSPVAASIASLGQAATHRLPARAVAKKHTGKRSGPALPQTASLMPAVKRIKLDGEDRLCGMECEGQQGIPPSLHCQICMCMFHPECVGCDTKQNVDGFTCQTCKMVKSSIHLSNHRGSPTLPFNPALPLPGIPQSLPPLLRAPHNKPDGGLPMTNGSVESARPIAPPAPAMRYISGKTDGSQVSGQLLTLPATVTSKLNLTQPLQLKMSGQTFIVPPSCFLNGPDGVKVLLPSGSLAKANGPLNVKVQSLGNGAQPAYTTTASQSEKQTTYRSIAPQVVSETTPQNTTPGTTPQTTSQTVSQTIPQTAPPEQSTPLALPPLTPASSGISSKRSMRVNPSVCHFHKLHAGFDCMVSIFQHLSMPDLLSASQICKTWHRLASQRCFWRSVSLRDVKVTDWSAAAKTFQLQQTVHLDMRDLAHPENDHNRTWHELTASLLSLQSLRSVQFGHCPSNILYAIAEKLVGLHALTAEFITDGSDNAPSWPTNTKLDIGKLSALSEMRELKLRAVCGLELPAFSLSGGLTQLGTLTKLTTLCLTTLRDVPEKEFAFLGSLVNLTVLELGDCNTWTAETYIELGKLCELKKLKLVAGGEMPDPGLGTALQQLHRLRHLELIKYVIASNLSAVLPTLSALQTFCVWPDTQKQVALTNRHTMTAVSKMSQLQQLEWGILADNNAEATDNNNSSETAKQKIECIPMLAETNDDDDMTHHAGDTATDYISIKKVVADLCCHLATTKINVFCVPTTSNAAARDQNT